MFSLLKDTKQKVSRSRGGGRTFNHDPPPPAKFLREIKLVGKLSPSKRELRGSNPLSPAILPEADGSALALIRPGEEFDPPLRDQVLLESSGEALGFITPVVVSR